MTLDHMHRFREWRVTFRGVEADAPEAALGFVRDRPVDEAAEVEACDGGTRAAQGDVVGDDEYELSKWRHILTTSACPGTGNVTCESPEEKGERAMTTDHRLLFPAQTGWTDGPCFYAAAFSGFRHALLAGPFRTRREAEAALPAAEAWARASSGDPRAGGYRYAVYATATGHHRSILGEVVG